MTTLESLDEKIEALKKKNEAIEAEIATLKKENERIEAEVATLKRENERLKTHVSSHLEMAYRQAKAGACCGMDNFSVDVAFGPLLSKSR